MQQRNTVFLDTAAIFSLLNQVHGTVEGRAETEPMNVQTVSGTYFQTLGVQAQIGRMRSPTPTTTAKATTPSP
jgi:hypothetical protein